MSNQFSMTTMVRVRYQFPDVDDKERKQDL